jgi:hypothetical protein
MRKIVRYFETFLDELEENTYIAIPTLVGIILLIIWESISQKANTSEVIDTLFYSFILFIMGISAILGYRKGVLLQFIIVKGVIAKILNILFLISTWGIAILLLISLIR